MKRLYDSVRVLHLLSKGYHGGIERLSLTISEKAEYQNFFWFIRDKGPIFEQMKSNNEKNVIYTNETSFVKNLNFICDFIRKNNINVIVNHHCDFLPELYFMAILKKIKELKGVVVVHSCLEKSRSFKEWIFSVIRKKTLKSADGVIYVSKAGKTSYKNMTRKIKNKKEYVVYNGIPKKYLDEGLVCEHKCDVCEILYMGRLEVYKGLFNLLDALVILKSEGFKFQCTIVGNGTQKDSLVKKIKNLGLLDNVALKDATNCPEEYYKKNNIFVYPSICEEVFGISLVEAMAYGLVVITNKVGGTVEVLENGVSGLLADDKTSEGLASAIKKANEIIREKTSYDKFTSAARKKAREFEISNTIDGYFDVFYEILNG